jgi:hypothetical protein
MRARRLAATAALAALALGGLAACRAEPDAAGYVGAKPIKLAEADRIVDEVRPQIRDGQEREVTNSVVRMLVLREAALRYAQRQGITVPPADAGAFAEQQGLPPGIRFTQLAAEYDNAMRAVQATAKAAPPSEDDQREAYRNASANGPVAESFESVRQFFGPEQLGQAVGIRDLIVQVIAQSNVRLNPRFDLDYQVPVTIGQVPTWLSVDLDEKSNPVRDLS